MEQEGPDRICRRGDGASQYSLVLKDCTEKHDNDNLQKSLGCFQSSENQGRCSLSFRQNQSKTYPNIQI